MWIYPSAKFSLACCGFVQCISDGHGGGAGSNDSLEERSQKALERRYIHVLVHSPTHFLPSFLPFVLPELPVQACTTHVQHTHIQTHTHTHTPVPVCTYMFMKLRKPCFCLPHPLLPLACKENTCVYTLHTVESNVYTCMP